MLLTIGDVSILLRMGFELATFQSQRQRPNFEADFQNITLLLSLIDDMRICLESFAVDTFVMDYNGQ